MLDVLIEPMKLRRRGWVVLKKCLGEPNRAQWFREAAGEVAAAPPHQLGAATADVDDEDVLLGVRPTALYAQVDQPRLLLTGDHLHFGANRLGGPLDGLFLIAGVPHGAGRDRAYPADLKLVEGRCHAAERVRGRLDRFGSDLSALEDPLAQAGDLAVLC